MRALKDAAIVFMLIAAWVIGFAMLALAWSGGETGCGALGSAPCPHHRHQR